MSAYSRFYFKLKCVVLYSTTTKPSVFSFLFVKIPNLKHMNYVQKLVNLMSNSELVEVKSRKSEAAWFRFF